MSKAALLECGHLRAKACKHGTLLYYLNDQYIGRSLDLYGEFSEGEAQLFQQFLKPGMTVVDVGANIGVHTVFFARAVGRTGHVLAFEPQRSMFYVLGANLALNNLVDVSAFHAALGAKSGTIKVPRFDYGVTGNYGGLGLGKRDQGDVVSVKALDSFALEHCHLIKVDVEGMERDVLAGAEETIARLRPILYIENDRKEHSAALISWLLERNYRLFWHLPPLFNPNNHFGESDNVFGTIVSSNMICVSASVNLKVQNFHEINSPKEWWSD